MGKTRIKERNWKELKEDDIQKWFEGKGGLGRIFFSFCCRWFNSETPQKMRLRNFRRIMIRQGTKVSDLNQSKKIAGNRNVLFLSVIWVAIYKPGIATCWHRNWRRRNKLRLLQIGGESVSMSPSFMMAHKAQHGPVVKCTKYHSWMVINSFVGPI